jgi:hypothetical protein
VKNAPDLACVNKQAEQEVCWYWSPANTAHSLHVMLFTLLLTAPSCMQGYLPRGIDQSYISGFLARELTQAAARAADSSSSSSSSSSGVNSPSGAVLLSKVVSKYSQLMCVDHLALAVHKLAELQEQGTAGSSEVGAQHSRLACSV